MNIINGAALVRVCVCDRCTLVSQKQVQKDVEHCFVS